MAVTTTNSKVFEAGRTRRLTLSRCLKCEKAAQYGLKEKMLLSTLTLTLTLPFEHVNKRSCVRWDWEKFPSGEFDQSFSRKLWQEFCFTLLSIMLGGWLNSRVVITNWQRLLTKSQCFYFVGKCSWRKSDSCSGWLGAYREVNKSLNSQLWTFWLDNVLRDCGNSESFDRSQSALETFKHAVHVSRARDESLVMPK